MTLFFEKIEKYLNLLLVFLLPSQLGLHLWPNFAFVFGIRVDYLSPTIYLTDILFLILFLLWFIKSGKNILWKGLKKKKLIVLAFLIIITFNIFFSSSIAVSFLKWIKFVEIASFALYVGVRKDIFSNKLFFVSLFCSLVFFSLIGILQVIKGGTLGGILYYLGERNFNINTAGIALAKLGNTFFLRAYSTFPHPNSLSGYLAVGILILSRFLLTKKNSAKLFGFLLILISCLFTFSLSAFVGMIFCFFGLAFYKAKIMNSKKISIIILTFFGISLLGSVIAFPLKETNIEFSQSTRQRLDLANVAGKIISNNFLIGTGLNTFIINEININNDSLYIWLLQPVHNMYLLVLSEIGISGGLMLYYILFKVFKNTLNLNKPELFLAILFILTTGLFDHYWFTLQQNIFLIGLLVGISNQPKHNYLKDKF